MNLPSSVAIVLPRAEPIALVCDSPHSGTAYPDDFRYAVPIGDLRKCEDTHVEALWADVPDVGGTLIHARFPRSYIDVNRACDDFDAALLSEPWPAAVRPSEPCTRLGNGLVFGKTTTFAAIYDRKLSVDEVRHRIESCWKPYRAILSEAVLGARASFGRVWHLNLHSMPSNAYERLGRVSARPLADVVLGDLRGSSCSLEFTACVGEAFKAQGFSVAINDPYAGQDLIRQHGRPAEGCESLQVEINRKLYLDEETREPNSGFARTRAAVGRVLLSLSEFIRAESCPLDRRNLETTR
jgi:N-formylglutamate deformylase